MSLESNRETIRFYVDQVYNKKNVELIDTLLGPTYCRHVPANHFLISRDAQKQKIIGYHRAFPDMQLTIDELLADGDKVVLRATFRGTHLGCFENIEPTHRHIVMMTIAIMRLEDGKICEQWGGVNPVDLFSVPEHCDPLG